MVLATKPFKLKCILFLLCLTILGLHVLGISAGLYDLGIRIDIPQHILSGILFGILWLAVFETNSKEPVSKTVLVLSTVSFAVLGSVLWEILEFMLWSYLPSSASRFELYSPTVGELLSDLASGLIGGLTAGVYAMHIHHKKKE